MFKYNVSRSEISCCCQGRIWEDFTILKVKLPSEYFQRNKINLSIENNPFCVRIPFWNFFFFFFDLLFSNIQLLFVEKLLYL